MADFSKLVNKVLSDKEFAQKLLNAPEDTLREMGIEPTAEMLDALKGVDVESLQKLATAFGEDGAAL